MDSVDFIPVLLGTDANAYGMARSFYEEYGITSLAIGKGALVATANSKIVKVVKQEPRLEEDDIFVETLKAFASTHTGKKLLLVPCGDNYIKLLVRNQDKLKDIYEFKCIDEDLLMNLSLKENFYKVCDKYGFLYPKTDECTFENYKEHKPPFGFPMIIKPSNSVAYWNCHFPYKKKVFVAENETEYRKILDAIYGSSYKDTLILQEYIPGDDSHMRVLNAYCGSDKKVKLISLGRVLLEEQTPEGIGSYAAIINGYDEELSMKMKSFLEDIGYIGFANFDMKYDERDGKYKLFEMNLRQGRSSYFVTAGGYNLAKYLVDDIIYHKDDGFTIANNKVLWSIIPKKVIYKYVSDESLINEAKELINQGKYVQSMFFGGDAGLKRRIYFYINQRHYVKKYKECFGNKGLR
ncbi:MAG: ATP-grasp domain-containing protein [Catonella sp.]|nr:ATP-grasp domain-containing protein [Catonella sp.]